MWPTDNPFVFGSIVKDDAFIDRELLIKRVFEKLVSTTGHSVVLVGPPHSGKSSLLAQIASLHERQKAPVSTVGRLIFHHIDAHELPRDFTPLAFWNDALVTLNRSLHEQAADVSWGELRSASVLLTSLKRVFAKLQSLHLRLVISIDEFDALLAHPEFQFPEFYSTLRSLNNSYDSLCILVTSRVDLGQLQDRVDRILPVGSPLLNHLGEQKVTPFDDAAIEKLLDRGNPLFRSVDKDAIRMVAGRSPFLLQAFAWYHYQDRLGDQEGQVHFEECYESLAYHFKLVFQHDLDDKLRAAFLLLTLSELDNLVVRLSATARRRWDIERYTDRFPELSQCGLAHEEYAPSDTALVVSRWRVPFAAVVWVTKTFLADLFRVQDDNDWNNLYPDTNLSSAQWTLARAFVSDNWGLLSTRPGLLLNRLISSYIPWQIQS